LTEIKPKVLFKKVSLYGASLILAYSVLLSLGYMLQRSFILHPKKLDKTYVYTFDFKFEELNIPIEEGFVNAIHAFTNNELKKGVILYFHGNADNLKRWGKVSSAFTSRGYDVVMMDYRGFGKSDGKATEKNMYSDAEKVYEYALKTYNEKDIILYGRSIGSGVAAHLASIKKTKALFLETPFYSIEDVVKQKYPFILLVLSLEFQFPNYSKLDSIETPIHIFHGTKDKVVPYKSAQKLKSLLKDSDTFLTLEGAGHKNIPTFEAYQQVLNDLL
jgi:pimeloyl-ACP methyl ester carboxylesterase